jgi:hypothetical protein
VQSQQASSMLPIFYTGMMPDENTREWFMEHFTQELAQMFRDGELAVGGHVKSPQLVINYFFCSVICSANLVDAFCWCYCS